MVFDQLNDRNKTTYEGIQTLDAEKKDTTYHVFKTSITSNPDSQGPYLEQSFYFSTDSLQLKWIKSDGHSSSGKVISMFFQVLNGLVPREFAEDELTLQPCIQMRLTSYQ